MIKLSKAAERLAHHLKAGKADSQTVNRLMNGELRFDERVDYVRKDIGNLSGTISLIDETVSKADGTVSIHQGKLPQNVYASYDRVLIGYESTGSTEVSPDADPLYSPDMQTWDDPLRNGLLIIRQDDNIKLEIPCSACGTFADSDRRPQEVGYEFNTPLVLEPGKLIEVELKVPNAIDNTASTSHNVEVMLFGVATASKG